MVATSIPSDRNQHAFHPFSTMFGSKMSIVLKPYRAHIVAVKD